MGDLRVGQERAPIVRVGADIGRQFLAGFSVRIEIQGILYDQQMSLCGLITWIDRRRRGASNSPHHGLSIKKFPKPVVRSQTPGICHQGLEGVHEYFTLDPIRRGGKDGMPNPNSITEASGNARCAAIAQESVTFIKSPPRIIL